MSDFAVYNESAVRQWLDFPGCIGALLNGSSAGRSDRAQITLYKSLGHIVQGLAAARYIHDRASTAA